MCFVRIFILLVSSILLLGCEGKSAPELAEVRVLLQDKKNSFEALADMTIESGVDRVSREGVYPKDSLTLEEFELFQTKFDDLMIDVGVQVDKEGQVIEFILWSSGILDRGEAVILLFSEREISSVAYYREQMDKGKLMCKKLEAAWYFCSSV